MQYIDFALDKLIQRGEYGKMQNVRVLSESVIKQDSAAKIISDRHEMSCRINLSRGNHCPDCGVHLIRLGSCFTCPACGWGGCG